MHAQIISNLVFRIVFFIYYNLDTYLLPYIYIFFIIQRVKARAIP